MDTTAKAEAKAMSWRLALSGFFLSIAGLGAGGLNYAFQIVIGRQLGPGEYGLANSALSFAGFLGLSQVIATTAVTHFVARYQASADHARLEGLLAGCRKFLIYVTIGGSLLAIVLIKPLNEFFHFPRYTLMIAVLIYVMLGLWSSLASALFQGMGWFGRFAFIGLVTAVIRLLFGFITTGIWHTAEWAILASAAMLSAYLLLFIWRKELPRHSEPISPWNKDFIKFLLISAACNGGIYFFTQSDLLVAQRYFSPSDRDAYAAAQRLAGAIPILVNPLLTVLFAHRSGTRKSGALEAQLKVLGLYAVGMLIGALSLFVLKDFCVKLIFGRAVPESAAMIARLAVTMCFAGLAQALAMWALASYWTKTSLLYGLLGFAYWMTLLALGKTPTLLLQIMPMATAVVFAVLFIVWFVAMKQQNISDETK